MRIILRLVYTGTISPADWGGQNDTEELPVDLVVDVIRFAKRYMIDKLMNAGVDVLKRRLGKTELDFVTFDSILTAAITIDVGCLRYAAMDLAKKSSKVKNGHFKEVFSPMVQAELQGLWPTVPPAPSSKRIRFC